MTSAVRISCSRRAWLRAIGVAAAAAGLAACSLAPSAPTAAPPQPAGTLPPPAATPPAAQQAPGTQTELKFGYLSLIQASPFYIAFERGYFKDLGINVNPTLFASGTEEIPLLATGDLPVGSGAINVGLFNSWQRNVPTTVVADGGTLRPDYDNVWVVLAKKYEGVVTSWADLKSKKISASSQGALVDYVVQNALKKAGMTSQDVDISRLSQPDSLVALQTGAVDAVGVSEPFATQAVDSGVGVKWQGGADIVPGTFEGAVFFSNKLTGDRALATAVLQAWLRGVRDFVPLQQSDPAILEIIQKYTKVDAAVLKRISPSYVDLNGEFNPADLQVQQQFWIAQGLVTAAVDPTPFVNLDFTRQAVSSLGRATPPAS